MRCTKVIVAVQPLLEETKVDERSGRFFEASLQASVNWQSQPTDCCNLGDICNLLRFLAWLRVRIWRFLEVFQPVFTRVFLSHTFTCSVATPPQNKQLPSHLLAWFPSLK